MSQGASDWSDLGALGTAAEIGTLSTSPDPQRRSEAAQWAGQQPLALLSRSVVEHLCDDSSQKVRCAAARSAAHLLAEGDTLGLSLLEVLLGDELLSVRGAAVFALGQAAEHDDGALDLLIRCVLSQNVAMSLLAASVFAEALTHSPRRALPMLARQLDDLADIEARSGKVLTRVVSARGHADLDSAAEILSALASHRDPELAEAARDWMARLDSEVS